MRTAPVHLCVADSSLSSEAGRWQDHTPAVPSSFLPSFLHSFIHSGPFQLLDQLVHKEMELQRKEVEAELREEQKEVQGWERAAG